MSQQIYLRKDKNYETDVFSIKYNNIERER